MKRLLILCVALSACAKTTNPVTNINDALQQDVAEIINYAQSNMEIDTDKQLLINGLKDCAARAGAMEQTCATVLEKCQIEQNKLKLERNGLFVIIIGLIGFILYRPIRKLFGL